MSRRGKYLAYEIRKSSGFAGDGSKVRGFAPSLVVLRGLQRGKSKSPFAILSFNRQRRFLSHARKKAGLKSLLRTQSVKRRLLREKSWCRRRRLSHARKKAGLNLLLRTQFVNSRLFPARGKRYSRRRHSAASRRKTTAFRRRRKAPLRGAK